MSSAKVVRDLVKDSKEVEGTRLFPGRPSGTNTRAEDVCAEITGYALRDNPEGDRPTRRATRPQGGQPIFERTVHVVRRVIYAGIFANGEKTSRSAADSQTENPGGLRPLSAWVDLAQTKHGASSITGGASVRSERQALFRVSKNPFRYGGTSRPKALDGLRRTGRPPFTETPKRAGPTANASGPSTWAPRASGPCFSRPSTRTRTRSIRGYPRGRAYVTEGKRSAAREMYEGALESQVENIPSPGA